MGSDTHWCLTVRDTHHEAPQDSVLTTVTRHRGCGVDDMTPHRCRTDARSGGALAFNLRVKNRYPRTSEP